ncbi:hypothetical protein MJD09_05665 [bacterium]|nr:hypothetical protein [bacterium]
MAETYSLYQKRGVYYIQWYDETGKKKAKSLRTKDEEVAELWGSMINLPRSVKLNPN